MGVRLKQRRRGQPKWLYRFSSRGIWYERTGFATRTEALLAEGVRRQEVGAGGGPTGFLTLERAIAQYLAEKQMGRWGGSVKPALRSAVEHMGGRVFSEVKAQHVQGWRDAVLAWQGPLPKGRRHVGTTTANRYLACMQALYSWGQAEGLVPEGYNPAAGSVVKRAAEPWRAWVVLSEGQRAELLASLPPQQRVQAELLYLLGVRLQVVMGLEWERVDWSSRLVQYRSKGRDAVIPLAARAYELLMQLWQAQGCPISGKVMKEGSVGRLKVHWNRARVRLGLPRLRRHDLRVAFARELASQGADLKTIQGLLGHAHITMTSRYIPADLGQMRRAVDGLR